MSRAEVAAVFELERMMHRSAADRFERIDSGFVAAAPSLPDVWDASLVQLEPGRPLPTSVDALAELAELPSSWYGEIRHRTVFAGDLDHSRELALSLARRGWEITELRLLVIRQAPGRRVANTAPLSGNAMRRIKGRLGVELGSPPRINAQLDRYDSLRSRVASRTVYGALDAAGNPAAIADSYLRGDMAVIEDVATLRRHRRRGLASAAVRAAVGNAIGLGARAVALFAEPELAQRFYGPLGFEEIGGAYDCKLVPPVQAPLRRD